MKLLDWDVAYWPCAPKARTITRGGECWWRGCLVRHDRAPRFVRAPRMRADARIASAFRGLLPWGRLRSAANDSSRTSDTQAARFSVAPRSAACSLRKPRFAEPVGQRG